ncbi:bile acid:sodium symporter family protein [Chloroflexota bacterium]
MSVLRNNSFILALALIAGIALGQGAAYTRTLIAPLLAVIMTLSLVGVSSDVFTGGAKLLKPALLALLLNYGLLAGAFIGLSFLFIDDPQMRAGYVLIAAVPPAVAVIPFTYRLGGDVSFTLVGSVAGHLAAFVMTPLITLLVLGSSLVEPKQLLLALLQLIAIPFVVSRLLRLSARVVNWLNRYRGTLVNWGFFVVVYTIIGLNRAAFLGFSQDLLAVVLVSALCTFGIAFSTYGIGKLAGVTAPTRVSYTVMAAWKNYGLAGAIALLYFGEAAALPAAVTTAFAIANFIVLSTTIAVRPQKV